MVQPICSVSLISLTWKEGGELSGQTARVSQLCQSLGLLDWIHSLKWVEANGLFHVLEARVKSTFVDVLKRSLLAAGRKVCMSGSSVTVPAPTTVGTCQSPCQACGWSFEESAPPTPPVLPFHTPEPMSKRWSRAQNVLLCWLAGWQLSIRGS